jgi:two-component system chemotaxis sensor kinase CheA
MEKQDDLINEFVAEAREHLTDMEADLLTIEEMGASIDEELVNKVFRAAHSIKGGSSFFGLNRIKELSHKAETVLDLVRSRKMVPNPEITNILLAAFDKLRDMINNISESENMEISDHVVSLNQLASAFLPGEKKAGQAKEKSLRNEAAQSISEDDLERAGRTGQFIYLMEYDLLHDVERQGKNILQVFDDLYASGEILDCNLDFETVGTLGGPVSNQVPLKLTFATILEPNIIGSLVDLEKSKIRLLFNPDTSQPGKGEETAELETVELPPEQKEVGEEQLCLPAVSPEEMVFGSNGQSAAALQAASGGRPEDPEGEARPRIASGTGESTLRVDVHLLESLMNLAGELVLSRNQLREAVALNDRRALVASSQRVNLITSELQDAIMQTRMQSIGNVFGKFPRVVRDIARATNKEIQVDIRGKDVGLDKSLIEGLSDPLTHMVRNAADHGIEFPEDRVQRGKTAAGNIRLEARHEAGHVVVEVADDGKGLDPQRIAASALEKGLITQEKLQGMSDKDKMALVFLPGLSTVDRVTDLSGRGVGMDVVKTNLDRLGGKVEIESEPGKGTVFRIKLPLTLAIIPSLIVTVQGTRFAIPQISVVELLHIRAEQVKKRIEVVGDAEVLILRDQLVPLVRFSDFLGIMPIYVDPDTGNREICRRRSLADRRSPRRPLFEDSANVAREDQEEREDRRGGDRRRSAASDIEIAVVTTGTIQYGLVVDSFKNTEEIVVKPLGRHLKGLQEYAGATIMGDGKVALILDVTGLALKADLKQVSASTRAVQLAEDAERERLQDMHSLLLFYNAPDELCATPLDTVLRVERVSGQQIEMAGGRRTMQYRGASLPLVTLSDAAQVQAIESEGRSLAVIVSTVKNREVGLLGAMPVDVVETRAEIDQRTHRQKGIAGSAIIRDKTVLLTDVYELVDSIYPEWGAASEKNLQVKEASTTVLLAEDSDFFRSQVKRYLEEGGYKVLDAPDGEAAWELLLENSQLVRAVVTDIEMPRLTGLGLTQRIRSEPRLASLPIIGLTSLAGEEDIAKGKAAGITDYQVKLDRDKLLAGLNDLLQS